MRPFSTLRDRFFVIVCNSTIVELLLHGRLVSRQILLVHKLVQYQTHLTSTDYHYFLNRHACYCPPVFGTSIIIASPWPPPEQIAAIPIPPPRRFNS